MNLTELARILRVTPNELKDHLPAMGFDIGQKAIKIDNHTSKKIISLWPNYIRRKEREDRQRRRETLTNNNESKEKKKIAIGKFVVVRDFAVLAGLPVNRLVTELMKNGIFASLNEKIDFDTAMIVGADLGLEIVPEEISEEENSKVDDSEKIKQAIGKEADCDLCLRPPVIVVMGHVDHGKTMLLDAVRNTNVIAGEAGGITQHIGAYQVMRKNKFLTFIDTPGHEAFTAMRNRGAKVADIAILVVAADDGVKPQTVEAFRIIQAANIPYIVAINKIDKDEANIDRVKQELANQLNILVEGWGGNIIAVPISAKNGTNIEELLDMLILVSDVDQTSLRANPDGQAIGTIIESNMDKSEGIVATLLVQNGTLRVGDELMYNGIDYGRARGLKNYLGQNVSEVGPSTPVKIIGFKTQPEVGDIIEVGRGEKIKNKKAHKAPISSSENSTQSNDESSEENHENKIIIMLKGDTLGTVEAIENSLGKIDTQGVKVKIVAKGLGNVTEGDVSRAEAVGAKLLGFSVKASPKAMEMAREKKVSMKIYKIIYELINDIKAEIQELVKPEIVRVDLGKVKILAIFRSDKKSQILGGKVISGVIRSNTLAELVRHGEIIEEGKIISLKTGKEEVKEVENGTECGFLFESRTPAEKDDVLNVYQEDKIYKKIK
ncbi:MAG: translation initiation factor IF-2 [Patescibacteria group bacterium]|nr:translation initiation factor IF-2 [Patescibacteria group bacterium]